MHNFTVDQQKAVDKTGLDLLLSASAGSGKTTVLVERVIKKLEAGVPIKSLLIVTFTKAATADMKEKIQRALEQKIAENPADDFFQNQLIDLQSANISTIDSFCLDVVGRFYQVIDLDPNFSLLVDEVQLDIMKEQALKNVLTKNLDEQNVALQNLLDNISGSKDLSGIYELIFKLHQTALAMPNYQNWLDEVLQQYDVPEGEITKLPTYNQIIKPMLVAETKTLIQKLSPDLSDLNELALNPKLAKLAGVLETGFINLQNFARALEDGTSFDELRDLCAAIKPATTTKPRNSPDDELIYLDYHVYHEMLKDFATRNYKDYFYLNNEQQVKELATSKGYVATILALEREFIAEFGRLKQARNVLDFSDTQQYAYQILSAKTTAGELAQHFYQEKFSEILLDEYQDTSPIQEEIFQAIENPDLNHMFMVGDVKQSIYRFRQAEPDLFIKKFNKFKEPTDEHERIMLAENFRSTSNVTAFVNSIFDEIMTPDFGGINYKAEGRLIAKAHFPESLESAVEVELYDKNGSENNTTDETLSNANNADNGDSDDVENSEIDFHEIQLVVARIKKMQEENFQVFDRDLDGVRTVEPRDIAILTRNKSENLNILTEFNKNGIPLLLKDAQNYFQTVELTMIMSYLKIIDNPAQDIPLVSVLRSPMYSFDEVELAEIKIHSHATAQGFFSRLGDYQGEPKLEQKIAGFLADLSNFRSYANLHRISELIWHIFESTRLLEIVTGMLNGRQRRLNLQSLYERAAAYEESGFKDLYDFISFITRLQKSKKDLAQPLLADATQNAVTLMTMHGSKGLEFPVVFVVGLGKKFNTKDFERNYTINSHYGIGLANAYDYTRVNTLMKVALTVDSKKAAIEEEARLLYVAFTRAKQKLIVVCAVKDLDKTFGKWLESSDGNELPLPVKTSAKNFLELIGPILAQQKSQSIVKHPSELTKSDQIQAHDHIKPLYVLYQDDDLAELNQDKGNGTKVRLGNFIDAGDEIVSNQADLKQLFTFKYQYQDSTTTTAYQAVSEIKHRFSDPNLKELENTELIKATNRYLQPIEARPDFEKEIHYSAADIGTATHLILQRHDFTQTPSLDQLTAEISGLVADQIIDQRLAEKVNLPNITNFLLSDFGQSITAHATTLEREVSFSTLVPATELFDNFADQSSKILIHGTIDGYFKSEKGIILFDYKTDHIDPKNEVEGLKQLVSKYQGQLRLYEMALNEFSDQKVVAKYLIALAANQIISVD